ncbi:uncharacterized protein ARMOST_02899 [Armillaria ostoyae]|uniref:Uncharacterized protein n=1 Tax=Armillaria ostoyae TaxID=47428 RepID=A0A284QT71_ARMOS|nr:uncharacterized protein ARMOST_02899 [Armillaria ostoyae]
MPSFKLPPDFKMPDLSTPVEFPVEHSETSMSRREMVDAVMAGVNNELVLGDAKTLFRQGKYAESAAAGIQAARNLVGENFALPRVAGHDDSVRCNLYESFNPHVRRYLMACCNGVAQALVHQNRLEEALAWYEEVEILHLHCSFESPKPLFDWKDFHFDLPDMTLQHTIAKTAMADIYLRLGNTGRASYTRWRCFTIYQHMPAPHHSGEIKILNNVHSLADLLKLRHPDPSRTPTLEVTDPGLQVRGSWKRLHTKAGSGIAPRSNFASFIWKGKLYVAGGYQGIAIGPYYRDIWCLDLTARDGWKELAKYPVVEPEYRCLMRTWTMKVYKDKAYLFTGKRQVDFFDLEKGQWGSISTTYERTTADKRAGMENWLYPHSMVDDACMEIADGKLYVFGGTHNDNKVGCNLLVALDLETKKWRRLGGHLHPKADPLAPDPRKTAMSWVNKEQDRLFILGGEANRPAATRGDPVYANDSFIFENMWSWHIPTEKWRRERMSGNLPSARSEVAHAFNPVLNKFLLFGGYSTGQDTIVLSDEPGGRAMSFKFTYFADTFMYDPVPVTGNPDATPTMKAPKWKHVLTRGFPTYRCQANLIVDPDNGKTYMFGGYTNTQLVPMCKQNQSPYVKAFNDLWQLKLDTPGGDFADVDVEEEALNARAGPWRRCFNCASTGYIHKCGGSCGGRAYFCGKECLREGWKAHKERHRCRKA